MSELRRADIISFARNKGISVEEFRKINVLENVEKVDSKRILKYQK